MTDKIKFWTEGVEVQGADLNQLHNIAKLPILAGHIAVMPDVHFGIGATVGSVIPTRSAIIPAAVGVDIGCGMMAGRTNINANRLDARQINHIRADIEAYVPVGFSSHNKPLSPMHDGLEGISLHRRMKEMEERFLKLSILDAIGATSPASKKVWLQAGTLGGGNHFIEVCLDTHNDVWVMLHSGSRNIGKTIGEISINRAREYALDKGYSVPDRDLSWFDEGTPEFQTYIEGMLWAQDYARLNRDLMMHEITQILKSNFSDFAFTMEMVNCHHNFSSLEEHFGEKMWVTRKGAVSARQGQYGIIPGSMGAKSFIVTGKGNPDSYCSCSHGAGRRMSRGAAKKAFTLDDLSAQTANVSCRKDAGVIDEIPGAYKDIDAVMAAQADLVQVEFQLKQILCVKG